MRINICIPVCEYFERVSNQAQSVNRFVYTRAKYGTVDSGCSHLVKNATEQRDRSQHCLSACALNTELSPRAVPIWLKAQVSNATEVSTAIRKILGTTVATKAWVIRLSGFTSGLSCCSVTQPSQCRCERRRRCHARRGTVELCCSSQLLPYGNRSMRVFQCSLRRPSASQIYISGGPDIQPQPKSTDTNKTT